MKVWSFAKVWNQALDTDRQRELKPRDYVWASELGRGYYDRYWKMKGRAPTTPPNLRARRKFEAGNLMEWVVQQVLTRAGVLENRQVEIEDTSGPIKVRGRCDFIAGGQIQEVDLIELGLPEDFAVIAETVIENLKKLYPDGLPEQGLEVKSCAAVMFERYLKAPGTHHALQAYFYAKGTNLPYTLAYVCRDDLRIHEWTIYPNARKWKALYEHDLHDMTEAFSETEEGIVSWKENQIKWDVKDERFVKNFEVEYSSYLTDYGHERPDQYVDTVGKVVTSLNYVLARVKAGKALTKMNLEKHLPTAFAFDPNLEKVFNNLKEHYEKK